MSQHHIRNYKCTYDAVGTAYRPPKRKPVKEFLEEPSPVQIVEVTMRLTGGCPRSRKKQAPAPKKNQGRVPRVSNRQLTNGLQFANVISGNMRVLPWPSIREKKPNPPIEEVRILQPAPFCNHHNWQYATT
ncbi:hypothetical protein CEXT_302121 [Caerostris extrusa]|uniref:Uncharacterized protein n=1 Tax=Caerostris extrusa TaxID=172846 RepID=A0AAV4P9U0_CAEEX|nr:hypothetical protein CEXT_302121 [Caerostris extrusa]